MNAKRDRRLDSREFKMFAKAMRAAPSPEPPDGLRARLLVLVGEDARPAPSGRSVWRFVAAGAVCIAAAAAWFGRPVNGPSRRHEAVTLLQPAAQRSESVVAPRLHAHPVDAAEKSAARPRAIAKGRGRPRLVFPGAKGGRTGVAREAWDEPAAMTVAVGHATPTTVGVARASAMMSDGAGGWVKTEWVMVRDPRSHVARQRVTYTDPANRRRRLTVAAISERTSTENNNE